MSIKTLFDLYKVVDFLTKWTSIFFLTKSSEYYGGNRDKFCRHFTPSKSVKHTHSSSKLQQSSFVEYSNANNHFQAVFKTETAVMI